MQKVKGLQFVLEIVMFFFHAYTSGHRCLSFWDCCGVMDLGMKMSLYVTPAEKRKVQYKV